MSLADLVVDDHDTGQYIHPFVRKVAANVFGISQAHREGQLPDGSYNAGEKGILRRLRDFKQKECDRWSPFEVSFATVHHHHSGNNPAPSTLPSLSSGNNYPSHNMHLLHVVYGGIKGRAYVDSVEDFTRRVLLRLENGNEEEKSLVELAGKTRIDLVTSYGHEFVQECLRMNDPSAPPLPAPSTASLQSLIERKVALNDIEGMLAFNSDMMKAFYLCREARRGKMAQEASIEEAILGKMLAANLSRMFMESMMPASIGKAPLVLTEGDSNAAPTLPIKNKT